MFLQKLTLESAPLSPVTNETQSESQSDHQSIDHNVWQMFALFIKQL